MEVHDNWIEAQIATQRRNVSYAEARQTVFEISQNDHSGPGV
jgi:hypothetical protein